VTLALALVACACTSPSGSSGDLGGADDREVRQPRRRLDERPAGEPEEVACESGTSLCGGACVDLATDPDHCGRCGHGCLGGACVEGKCQPVTLASGLGGPQGLAIGPDGLYVTLLHENRVVRIPKGGGEVETISSSTTSPWGIAVTPDAPTRLVWGETRGAASNVVTCEVPCDDPKKVAVGADVWHVAIGRPFAYWAASSQSAGSIQRCRLDDCSMVFDVVENQPRAHGLVVSGGSIAFGVRSSQGVVRRASTSGAGLTDLVSGLDAPKGLATDGTTLFVAVGGSRVIARCPLTGCAPGEQSTIALANNPHTVATDGVNVYWTNGLAEGGSIHWCPVEGCSGSGRVLATGQKNPYSIAVDDEAVYWTNAAPDGQVMRIARP